MLLKILAVVTLLAILASLGSAAVFLLRRKPGQNQNMARALTWRVGLSIALFALLMASFYFGIITPHGLTPS